MIIQKTIPFETEWGWETLKNAACNGSIKEALNSGDKIAVELKNGEQVVFEATYDKNGKLYLVTCDCLAEEHVMNKVWTNKGGWAACDMRTYLNSTMFALLPDDLQAVIADTKIVQVLDGKRSECEDKLFLLSHTQVFGTDSYTKYEPEDSHLDIFTTEKSRVKECGNNGTWFWWLRSPYSSGSTNFCGVGNYGYASGNGATNSSGVAFGFCLN